MANILAIDDDRQILAIIKKALEKEGHEVTIAETVLKINQESLQFYDLILLDVMMPGVDGFTYCQQIREMVDCPILFITAKTMEQDLIEGFEMGADDYIRKPFSLAEIRVRVNAHLRSRTRHDQKRLISGPFVLNLSEKQLYYEQIPIKLTKSEYELCAFLMKNKGQVFSLEQLIEKIFGYDSESDTSAIREHIKNIRAKFKVYEVQPIDTVWGIGYKWH